MKEDNQLINLLEKKLDTALLPVDIEEKYVDQLRVRLFKAPLISVEKDNYLLIVSLICLSFITGLIFVFILSRMFSSNRKRIAS